jgi:DNA replication and repair protein RecF
MKVSGMRNLKPAELSFSPGLNVFLGDNGQGKTSLLESIAVGTTSRSFRTDLSKDVIGYSENDAMVDLDIAELGLRRQQRVILTRLRKNTLIDGKRINKVAEFALKTPIVVFHPLDLTLVSGPAALRRTLLDRVSLYLLPMSLQSLRSYLLALRERQKLLVERGVNASGLDAFEQVISEHGAYVSSAHAQAAEQLTIAFSPIALSLFAANTVPEIGYVKSGTTDPKEFREKLKENRSTDLYRGRASFGPQRDDITLYLNQSEARKHASQGQQRLLALALKLSELSAIRRVRLQHPVLLLDDVVSELDPLRTVAVMDWVSRIKSQVFVTTTRLSDHEQGLFPTLPRRKFWVRDGVAEQE